MSLSFKHQAHHLYVHLLIVHDKNDWQQCIILFHTLLCRIIVEIAFIVVGIIMWALERAESDYRLHLLSLSFKNCIFFKVYLDWPLVKEGLLAYKRMLFEF